MSIAYKENGVWETVTGIPRSGDISRATIDSIYPVGSLYMSINNAMPPALTEGRTWELLSGNYVLKTITEGTGGQTSNAGNTGSTTLTAAQSGVPAHSHGMGDHSHAMQHNHVYQVRAHGYWGGMAGSDTDTVKVYDYYNGGVAGAGWAADVHTNVNNGLQSGSTGRTITQTASSGYTAGADYVRGGVNTGAGGSGSTYNNSAANASEGHAHTAGMPANIGIYIWKRVA